MFLGVHGYFKTLKQGTPNSSPVVASGCSSSTERSPSLEMYAGSEKIQCKPLASCGKKAGSTLKNAGDLSRGNEPEYRSSYWPVMNVTEYSFMSKMETYEPIQVK